MMNEHGKSDRPVVPAKSPNKAGQPAAEGMEGSGLTKGNLPPQNASRTPSRTDAPGVDGETWRHYGETLEDNLQDLSHRLKRGAYRAKPVRRAYIDKRDGRKRPLGVPVLEDKIVQRATVEVLNAIYVAAKPAAVLADERSARETCPVVPVAIPGDGAGDQAVESPGVKVLVGKA